MSQDKQIVIKSYELADVGKMTDMAKLLRGHVVSYKLFTPIQGKNYVQVEGWQFAGGMLGILPRIASVEKLSDEKIVRWKAEAELIHIKTGAVVGRGFAICSSAEMKRGKAIRTDEYTIISMAQTRAIGKAYRNVIGWVMKLAGYESTPHEEMVGGIEPAADTPNKEEEVGPHKKRLESAKSIDELKSIWPTIPKGARDVLEPIKDELKKKLAK